MCVGQGSYNAITARAEQTTKQLHSPVIVKHSCADSVNQRLIEVLVFLGYNQKLHR